MDHRDSIQAAVDYIEARLSQKLTLEDIAAQALFSPWQFHRMFTIMVGMPVMAYVRARRLSEAAQALMHTGRRMIEIAQDAGYESQQAFTRAFVKTFGISPGACRKNKSLPEMLMLLKKWSYERSMETMKLGPSMVTIGAFGVAGIEVTTTAEENTMEFTIPKLWERFCPMMQAGIPGRADENVSYGVCIGGEGARFTYLAGVPLAEDVPNEGLVKRQVPGGLFAVFTHRGEVGTGKLAGITETLQNIYNTWLPESGYEYDQDRVDFEKYGPAFLTDSPEMEIWIPVKKKA